MSQRKFFTTEDTEGTGGARPVIFCELCGYWFFVSHWTVSRQALSRATIRTSARIGDLTYATAEFLTTEDTEDTGGARLVIRCELCGYWLFVKSLRRFASGVFQGNDSYVCKDWRCDLCHSGNSLPQRTGRTQGVLACDPL